MDLGSADLLATAQIFNFECSLMIAQDTIVIPKNNFNVFSL